jgi:hypothetical protein
LLADCLPILKPRQFAINAQRYRKALSVLKAVVASWRRRVLSSLFLIGDRIPLLNQAHPTQVQRMLRHRHYATTEVYVEEVKRLIAGAERAITQL